MKDEDYRAARIKDAIIVALLLALLVTLMPQTIVLNDRSFVGHFLKDYQTLIAGFMAVGAAWWTVKRMQRDDENAYIRHQETIKEGRKKDKLAVARFNTAVLTQLGYVRGAVTKFIQERGERQNSDAWTGDDLKNLRNCLMAASLAESVFQDKSIDECRHLFTPNFVGAFGLYKIMVESVLKIPPEDKRTMGAIAEADGFELSSWGRAADFRIGHLSDAAERFHSAADA